MIWSLEMHETQGSVWNPSSLLPGGLGVLFSLTSRISQRLGEPGESGEEPARISLASPNSPQIHPRSRAAELRLSFVLCIQSVRAPTVFSTHRERLEDLANSISVCWLHSVVVITFRSRKRMTGEEEDWANTGFAFLKLWSSGRKYKVQSALSNKKHDFCSKQGGPFAGEEKPSQGGGFSLWESRGWEWHTSGWLRAFEWTHCRG